MRKHIIQMTIIFIMVIFLSSCRLFTSDDGPFIVTFNSNGGTEVDNLSVDAFKPFLPEKVPTKEGYVFSGWYIDADLLYPMSFNTGTNQALTLYAKWIPASYLLSEEAIRSIVQSILDNQELMIVDENDLEDILDAIISAGGFVDYETILETVLSTIDVVESFEKKITAMLAEVSQSVVMIETYKLGQVDGGGSGVLYKKSGNTYYVLTNEHVIRDYLSSNLSITIFTPDGEIKIPKGSITIKKSTVVHDLAVLTFTSTQNYQLIKMGTKESLRVGQFVFALGSPLDLPNTVSMGIISAFNRDMVDTDGMNTITIQHSASINPGNSGGALVDANGFLVGINSMSYVDDYAGEGIEGLHFAIQIDVILAQLDLLE